MFRILPVALIALVAGASCGTSGGGDPTLGCQLLSDADINGGVTLLAGTCYDVESLLSVTDGTLTLQPGVQINFDQDAGISVQGSGRLNAIGSEAEPIVMTGYEARRGFWRGLRFQESRSDDNVLEHVQLEWAGGGKWHGGEVSQTGIFIEGGNVQLTIRNSVIRGNSISGISAENADSDVTLDSLLFEDNDVPVRLTARHMASILGEHQFVDNGGQYLMIDQSPRNVSDNVTWLAHAVPYRIDNRPTIEGHVTVEAGASFEFTQDAGLAVQNEGRFSVLGSSEAPILFTGVEKRRGFWRGFSFADSRFADNRLDHMILEYAGGGKWHGGEASQAGIFVQGDQVQLSVTNSILRENELSGITVEGHLSELTLDGNTFEKNVVPMRVAANHLHDFSKNQVFIENDNEHILVDQSVRTMVRPSTWQAMPVPFRFDGRNVAEAPLTIEPGTILEFNQNAGLQISEGGRLIADATGGERIVFRGAEGIAGFWMGLRFSQSFSMENVISNALITDGGSSGWHGGDASRANLFLSGSSDKSMVALNNVTLARSGHYSISVETESVVHGCTGLVFEGNAEDPLAATGAIYCE